MLFLRLAREGGDGLVTRIDVYEVTTGELADARGDRPHSVQEALKHPLASTCRSPAPTYAGGWLARSHLLAGSLADSNAGLAG